MSDMETGYLKMVLPAVTGSIDTWGNKLNSNFQKLDVNTADSLKKTSNDVLERTALKQLLYDNTVTVTTTDSNVLLSRKMVAAMVNALLPNGTIIMWYGTTANIPSGWALCNGQQVGGVTTPNLSDRFVIAAGAAHPPGTYGGNTALNYAGVVGAHVLSMEEMPYHTHGIVDNGHSHGGTVANHSHNYTKRTAHKALSYAAGGSYSDQLWQGDDTSNNTGGAAPGLTTTSNGTGVYADYRGANWGHNHDFGFSIAKANFYPLYYAVCYIMKWKNVD